MNISRENKKEKVSKNANFDQIDEVIFEKTEM